MNCQDFNSLSYLGTIEESIETFNTPFDCNLESFAIRAKASLVSFLTGTLIIPALAVYELAMSIFCFLNAVLNEDQNLKNKALEHTVTLLELPCFSLQFIFLAFFPCVSCNQKLDEESNFPKQKTPIKDILIKENEISEMRDFLDRLLPNSNLSQSTLLAMHESLE